MTNSSTTIPPVSSVNEAAEQEQQPTSSFVDFVEGLPNPSKDEEESAARPSLLELGEETLAQAMLIFLLADLRSLSAVGNIRTKFEYLSLDSDQTPRLTSQDFAGFGPHVTGETTLGVTARHIMAVLLLEILREAEEQNDFKQLKPRQKNRTPPQEKPAFLFLDRPSAQAANIFKRDVEAADGMPVLLHCYNSMIREDIRKQIAPVSRSRYPLNEDLEKRQVEYLAGDGLQKTEKTGTDPTTIQQQSSENNRTKSSVISSVNTVESVYPPKPVHFKPTISGTSSTNTEERMQMPNFLQFGKGKERKQTGGIQDPNQLEDKDGAPLEGDDKKQSPAKAIRQRMEKVLPAIQRAGVEGTGTVEQVLKNQVAQNKHAEKHLEDMANVQTNLLNFASLSTGEFSDDEIVDDTLFVAVHGTNSNDHQIDSQQPEVSKESQLTSGKRLSEESGGNPSPPLRVSFEQDGPNDDGQDGDQAKTSGTNSKRSKQKRYHTTSSIRTLMKEAVEARDPDRLAFIQGFFRPGTVSHALASSESQMVWLNDWSEKYECTYALSVDRAKHKVLLCFRGAYTSNDWKHVLDYYDTGTENPVRDEYPNRPAHIRLHAGFHKYLFLVRKDSETTKYDEITNQLDHYCNLAAGSVDGDFAANHPKVRITVTGHSLGSALATIFSLYASTEERFTGNSAIECVTFGAPYIGNWRFADAVKHQEDVGKLRIAKFHVKGDVTVFCPPTLFRISSRGAQYWHSGIDITLPFVRNHFFHKLLGGQPQPKVKYNDPDVQSFGYSLWRQFKDFFLWNLPVRFWRFALFHTLVEHRKRMTLVGKEEEVRKEDESLRQLKIAQGELLPWQRRKRPQSLNSLLLTNYSLEELYEIRHDLSTSQSRRAWLKKEKAKNHKKRGYKRQVKA